MAWRNLFIPFIESTYKGWVCYLGMVHTFGIILKIFSEGPNFLKLNHFDIFAPRFLFDKSRSTAVAYIKSCSIWGFKFQNIATF